MPSVRPPHARRAPRPVRWRLAGVLALAGTIATAPCAAAENRLPDLGDAAGEALDRAEEEKLGQAFLRQIRRRLSLVDDPEVNDYLDALGQRIARADPERRYRFFVVDAPTVNAFAGPGGVIALNAGLVVITESESELAAVLAHEIAHVTQRHLAQLIERSGLALARHPRERVREHRDRDPEPRSRTGRHCGDRGGRAAVRAPVLAREGDGGG